MAETEDLTVFRGVGAEEAEDFIRAVRVQAFKLGKADDQKWITTFASTAFAGKALRWYLRLPTSTRQDWDRLQEAVLENEWGRDDGSAVNPIALASAPVPAAAPPLPSPQNLTFTSSPFIHSSASSDLPQTSRKVRRAVIRVVTDDPSCTGYLAVEESRGRCYSNPKRKTDFNVSWKPPFPCALEILYDRPPKAWLGAQHLNPEHVDVTGQLGPGSAEYLVLTPVTDYSESPFRTLAHAKDYRYSGRFYVSMWNVLEDLSLLPAAEQSGCTFELKPLVLNSNFKEVILASDPATIRQEYTKLKKQVSLEPAKLILEMI